MTPLRTTNGILAGLAVLLFILCQFLPWGGFEVSGGSFGGFSFGGADVDANMWNVKTDAEGDSHSDSWYDSDADDTDGIGMVRAGIPIVLVGLVVGAVAAILTLAGRGSVGPALTLGAAVIAIVGTILFAIGISKVFDDAPDFEWAVSFYLAITACALLLVGGIVGLVGGDRSTA